MKQATYFLPAEWHTQRCVQLAWPDESTDWKPYLDEIVNTMVLLVSAITHREELIIAAQDIANTSLTLAKHISQEQMGRITFVECAINDTWARDYGGITLLSPAAPPLILDFCFNGWGNKYPSAHDNQITKALVENNALVGQRVDYNDFILEGGSIETDGCGTLFTTTRCLLSPHRNASMTQAEIELQLKCRLNVKRVVWLSNGQLIGDDTDGHIDTIVRLCPNDVILYVKPSADDIHAAEFAALEEELKALKTNAGEPYTLVALPLPDAIYYEGERLPATYANFLIINGAVLVPTYRQAAKDSEACAIIQKAFPDREIIPIDASVIIRQHGSIHCLTMQYPM